MPVAVTSTGGAPLALAGAHSLTTAVSDPRPAFRFAFVLDLGPLPASAAPVFDAASTQLRAVFEPLDVPVPAQAMHVAGGLVVVELGEPRRVHAVRLKSRRTRRGFGSADGKLRAKSARAYGSIRLFRLDGDNVSDKPTATAALGAGRVATFDDDDFTDARFAIGFDEGALELDDLAQVTLRSYPTDPRLAVADVATLAAQPFFFHAAGQLASATVDAGTQLAQALQQHADGAGAPAPRRAAVLVESDAECSFRVTAFAVSAKLVSETFAYGTIADADLTDAERLAARIRAARDPVSAHLRGQLGDGPLAAELTSLLHAGPLYDPMRFDGVQLGEETSRRLVAAPDGGDALVALNRLLLHDAFPDDLVAPDAKRTLRFPAGSVGERAVVVELPPGVQPSLARVTTSESVRDDRPATPDGVPAAGGAAPPRRGLHVGGDGWTAAGAEQDLPVTATGIALRLLPLTGGTAVRVELQPDRDGRPGGSAVARGTLELGPAGAPSWATMFFAEPAVLGSGVTWILLRAAAGAAVWLGEHAEEELRLLVLGDAGLPVREATLPALRPSYRLFSRDRPVAAKPAIALRVGGELVVPGPDGAYDVATALGNAAATSPDGSPLAIPLTFIAAVGGTVTVPPPRIEYALP